jgi:PPM family protein phosphatase
MMGNEGPKPVSDEMRSAAVSETGRLRSHNEDAFALLPERGLFIVSDGMGGHNAGATAARIVVDVLPQMLEQRLLSIPSQESKALSLAVRDAVVELSQYVRECAESHADLSGMGATLVLAYLRNYTLSVANMGDSRAYLYREGNLKQLTEDHSIVGMLLQDGEITPEEAKTHPARGIVSRYVGMEGTVYPDVKSLKISKGDRVLLCSDGLTGMITDEAISEILSKDGDLQQVCQSLVDAANQAAGRDNITVLLAEID